MITGLRLDNFRGFISTEDIHFGKINLFYGPNSGGKSTILRSLSLLKQSFAHNNVDHHCLLLPYSREGVDMGSTTSLHHNLDTSAPFSLSLTSTERGSFLLSRPKRLTCQQVPATLQLLKSFEWHEEEEDERVFFEDSSAAWTLSLTIAEGDLGSLSTIQDLHFGNQHFMVYCSSVEHSGGCARSAFADYLPNASAHLPAGKNFEVLHAAWDSAIQRRTQKLISGQRHVDSLRGIASLDEFDPSGCFSVDDVVFGSAYEAALADYLTSCCGEINAFANAVARDLSMLGHGPAYRTRSKSSVPSRETQGHDFTEELFQYFHSVAAFFGDSPTREDCVEWWKEDLKRSRLMLSGYSNADYDASDIPPLAHWMMSVWWSAFIKAGRPGYKKQYDWVNKRLCDSIDDVASIYLSAVRAASQSLAALRDIGPDRSSAERVYRVEPRQHAARDYVGRRATEIPRVLFESPRLLEDLNAWLKRVEIPYRLFVDPLEIRGGAGAAVRQTGLFELNAELSHTLNARINLSDVGHGLYKQLALPIQVLLGHNLIITIEEPETNIHPRLQAEIADLFIEAVTKHGHQIFAEAHSEILSLRLQRRISEGAISHEDVRLFYVHAPEGGPCEVLPLALDRHGTLLNEPPGGFFDEWLREV